MSDNIATTVNASIATDDIAGVHFQRFKLTIGEDGVNGGDVSSANPLPVEITSGGLTDGELRAAPIDVEQQPTLFVEKIDQGAVNTYIGQAAPGTLVSAAGWRIQRLSISGTVTTIEYADGDLSFNNIWDNRASLSYS